MTKFNYLSQVTTKLITSAGALALAVSLAGAVSAQDACVDGTGSNSVQCGDGAVASGAGSTAVGDGAVADGTRGVAIGRLSDTGALGRGTALGYDAQATGQNSVSIGTDSEASGEASIAIGADGNDSGNLTGLGAIATGDEAIAIGADASAAGFASTALGTSANAAGIASTALGRSANAAGLDSIALGLSASAAMNFSTALGGFASAAGDVSTALGHSASAAGDSSIAVGGNASAAGIASTALGRSANAAGANSTALGRSASAAGSLSTALGRTASAAGIQSIAVGYLTSAAGDDSIVIGTNAGDGGFARSIVIGKGAFAAEADHVILKSADIFTILGNGDVGIGTSAPMGDLDIGSGAADTVFVMSNNLAQWEIKNKASSGRLVYKNLSVGGVPFKLGPSAVNSLLSVGTMADDLVEVRGNLEVEGDVDVTGTLTTGGPTCGGGCDAVFGADYDLPSIEEHAAAMYANNYLPQVGPTVPHAPINLSERYGNLLNEVEKAHIYIAKLNAEKQALALENQQQNARLERLEALLPR